MTLTDAKALRNEIRDRYNYHCIVPLGHGPNWYFARIFGGMNTNTDFHNRKDFRSYHAKSLRRRRAITRKYEAMMSRRRSPIEILIDRACGRD